MNPIELLESRQLYSGIVDVTVSDDSLLIKGDNSGNSIALRYQGKLQPRLLISGSRHTQIRINGVIRPGTSVLSYLPDLDLTVDLGNGDDNLQLNNYYLPRFRFGQTSIQLGDGNDSANIGGSYDSLAIDAGNGDDSLIISSFYIYGNCSIQTGAGGDSLIATSGEVVGKYWFEDSSGVTLLSMGIYVRRQTVINTSSSIDQVVLRGCIFKGSFLYSSKGGAENVDLRQSRFFSTYDVQFGRGRNISTIQYP